MSVDDDDEDGGIWPELVGIGLTLAIILVLLGFTGWLHSFGDSLAVGRGYAVAAVLVLAIAASFLGMRVAAFWSILFAFVAGMPVVLATLWPGPTGSFSLYQKNLRFDNADLPALAADIRLAKPMALTAQEVSLANRALLEDLSDLLPHQLVCDSSGSGSVAVATRLPPVPGAELCVPGLAAMQVTLKEPNRETRVWIVSVHLHWPWPYGQSGHVDKLAKALAGLDGPVLMAGDFNMVRWGNSVQRLARAARAEAAGPSQGTYLGFEPILRLPIDHAFAPSSGRIELRGQFGSDHLGLLAWLAP